MLMRQGRGGGAEVLGTRFARRTAIAGLTAVDGAAIISDITIAAFAQDSAAAWRSAG